MTDPTAHHSGDEPPKYTPCKCSHIEPEHEPNAGECYSCDCAAYRPTPAVPQAPADQTALRDRVAKALADEDARTCGWGHGFLERYGADAETDGFVNAVLAAVLPAPVDPAALVRACASFVRDTYSGEWADDAAATLETDADKIERGEPCSLLRLTAVLPVTTSHDTDTSAGPVGRAECDALVDEADRLRREGAALHARAEGIDEQLTALRKQVAAPVDRAAVLREEADRIDATRADFPIAVQNGITWATAELRRHAAELRRVADETAATETQAATLSPVERTMLGYALDQAQERIWSEGGFTDEDQAAVDSLRRLTAEQPAAGARQDGAQR